MNDAADSHKAWIVIAGACLVLYVIVVVRTAWVCDDAYITFRTIDNLVEGYGLRWNPAERVQAYTNALWMLLLIPPYALTGEIYFTTIFLSLLFSALAVAIVAFRHARSAQTAAVMVLLLLFSKAFVDFSTSGLENPLTYFLLALFFLVYFDANVTPGRTFTLCLVASLGMVNRMDLALLFAPPVFLCLVKSLNVRHVTAAMLGSVPFVAWILFSLFYYGFPFPNTAYAKLDGSIDQRYILTQGMYYLYDSFREDPLTMITIAVGITTPWIARGSRTGPLSISILLYLLYVVKVGGDFMSGRFLTPAFFCSVIALSRLQLGRRLQCAAIILVPVIGFIAPNPPVLSGVEFGKGLDALRIRMANRGIGDERSRFYPTTGLLRVKWSEPLSAEPGAIEGMKLRANPPKVYIARGIGFVGYYAGPSVHIVDLNALADPLFARLPPIRSQPWIAHFARRPPDGYLRTLRSGRNYIADRNLAEYYEKLKFVTRGDLRDFKRLKEIWTLNTGGYNYLLPQNTASPPE